MTEQATEHMLARLFAPAARSDPYPIYRELLARPVAELPDGQWVVSGHAAANTVLRSPATVKAPISTASPEQEAAADVHTGEAMALGRSMFLNMDPPDHTRLRRLVSSAFTPRAVAGLARRMEALVDDWLSAASARGEMEIISELAQPLPVAMITDILGIPPEYRARFTQWGRAIADASGSAAPEAQLASREAFIQLAEFMDGVISDRRRTPGADILSDLLRAEEAGDRLSQRELVATSVLLLFAGYETTVNLIGNGLLALMRNPTELQRLGQEPKLTANSVEELLRYDPPIQLVARMTSADIETGGTVIPAARVVTVLIAAANRDPAVFERPDSVDIGRHNAGRHLAFASGIHFCLGAPLARAEAAVVFERFARLSRLELLDPVPIWRPGVVFRGLESLHARL